MGMRNVFSLLSERQCLVMFTNIVSTMTYPYFCLTAHENVMVLLCYFTYT